MQDQLDSQKLSKLLRMIHIALMISILIYGFLVYTLKAEWPDPPVTDQEQLMLFSILGLGACFVGMLVNRTLLKKERLKKSESPLQAILTGFIITWALFEAGTIFGLIYSFQSQDASQFHIFAALSLVSMLSHPPSQARIKALLQ